MPQNVSIQGTFFISLIPLFDTPSSCFPGKGGRIRNLCEICYRLDCLKVEFRLKNCQKNVNNFFWKNIEFWRKKGVFWPKSAIFDAKTSILGQKWAIFDQKWLFLVKFRPFFVKIQYFFKKSFDQFSGHFSIENQVWDSPIDGKFRRDSEFDLLFPGSLMKGRQRVELVKWKMSPRLTHFGPFFVNFSCAFLSKLSNRRFRFNRSPTWARGE